MSLADVDFNAIRALLALLETKSVTLAARRMGTTQPNMSRTLAKLRVTLGDPLFVSSGRGLEPTPFASALKPDVQRALTALHLVFDAGLRRAEHATSFPLRVAASDYASLVVLRPWFARQQAQTPRPRLRVTNPRIETIGAMQRGEVDLAIVPRLELEELEQFVFKPILSDHYVLVVRHGHALLRGRLTLERYLAGEHIVVENTLPGFSTVQRALVKLERSRNVCMRVPSLPTALGMAETLDVIASLPARMVKASGFRLSTRALPFAVEPLTLQLAFHPRWTTDTQHRKLRESLLEFHAGSR